MTLCLHWYFTNTKCEEKLIWGERREEGVKHFSADSIFYLFRQMFIYTHYKKYKRNIITCSLVCSRVKASSSSFFLRCSLSFLILSIKASCSCSEMFEKPASFLKQGLLSCLAKYPHQVPKYVKLLLYIYIYIYTHTHTHKPTLLALSLVITNSNK